MKLSKQIIWLRSCCSGTAPAAVAFLAAQPILHWALPVLQWHSPCYSSGKVRFAMAQPVLQQRIPCCGGTARALAV